MIRNIIDSLKKPAIAIGIAVGLCLSASAQINYAISKGDQNQTNFTVAAASGGTPAGTNVVSSGFQLEYAVNNGSVDFSTAITALNASQGASNFVFGLKTSDDPATIGWADTIIWVTNTVPTGSNATARARNSITNIGQARWICVATNLNFETNGMRVQTEFGQHRANQH